LALVGLSLPGLRSRNFRLKKENEFEGEIGSPKEEREGEGGAKIGDGSVEKV
jgi:hypothetical protein